MRRYVLLRQSEVRRHKSLYHLRILIDSQLVPMRGTRNLIRAHNSGTTCLRVYVPSQKNDPLCMTYYPYHFVGEVLLHPVYITYTHTHTVAHLISLVFLRNSKNKTKE